MVTNRSRGQMLLIMAVIFGVTILTTVVLLNALHAPANVSSQLQSSRLDDIELTEAQVADDLERLFLVHTSVNRTGEALPYAEEAGGPDDRFADVVRNYSELNAALAASESGASIEVTYVGGQSRTGMLVRQNDSTQNLTHAGYSSSEQNWTVLEDAEGVPRLTMNVTEEPADPDSPFKLKVEGGNDLTFDSDGVEGGGVDCELTYPVQVDATGGVGTVSNQTEVCGTVDFELPSGSFNVSFENGTQVNGTYTISGVEDDSTELEGNTFDSQQIHDAVVVNPVFRLQYTDPTLTHTSTFTLYDEANS